MTGETGAGKSIVIDAIMLIGGERANVTLIRSGEDRAEVEAVMTVPELRETHRMLDEAGIAATEELIIRCILPMKGRPKRYVNGISVTADYLKNLSRPLITIHGQLEHHNLLHTSSQLDYLDGFGRLFQLREKVRKEHQKYHSLLKEKSQFNERLERKSTRIVELRDLVEELNELALEAGEEARLIKDTKLLGNAERMSRLLGETRSRLQENEGSLIEQMENLKQNLIEATVLDPECEPFLKEFENSLYLLEDLGRALGKRFEMIEDNPELLSMLNERLNRIQRLQRKYGLDQSDALLELLHSAEAELRGLTDMEDNGNMLEQKLAESHAELSRTSSMLSEKRHQCSKDLDRKIVEQLRHLGMEKARFRSNFETDETTIPAWTSTGIDRLEFQISVNPGQDLKSLNQVASGGELSRTMLALKTVLQSHDPVSVLIFDEVDAGISGRIAEMVGRKLRSLGMQQQTLCVTHLPQIASFSDHHYVVRKELKKDSTFTSVRYLASAEEKSREVAQLIGGKAITEKTLSVAREMLEQAREEGGRTGNGLSSR